MDFFHLATLLLAASIAKQIAVPDRDVTFAFLAPAFLVGAEWLTKHGWWLP